MKRLMLLTVPFVLASCQGEINFSNPLSLVAVVVGLGIVVALVLAKVFNHVMGVDGDGDEQQVISQKNQADMSASVRRKRTPLNSGTRSEIRGVTPNPHRREAPYDGGDITEFIGDDARISTTKGSGGNNGWSLWDMFAGGDDGGWGGDSDGGSDGGGGDGGSD